MKERALTVVSNALVAKNTYEMVFRSNEETEFRPGQFVNVTIGDGFTLKRPFAVKSFSDGGKTFSICYAVVGAGTEALKGKRSGDTVNVTYPLGNGFLMIIPKPKRIALIGGGAGIYPLDCVKCGFPSAEIKAYYGFRSAEYVIPGLDGVICTDDGSAGIHGNSVDAFFANEDPDSFDYILACGPRPMLLALQSRCADVKAKVLASLEARMGCGVGACLACAVKVNGENMRVCRDGPVFDIREVEL